MKPKIIIIAGPTAVGKTAASVELATMLHTEIISADSMQIYKGMDIGSAKVTKNEMNGIKHHLINVIDPKDSFTVAEYKVLADEAINHISAMGNIPIIVGGTGLYIDSLIYNYDFTDANKDSEYRKYLENLAAEKGNLYLFEMLEKVDKVSAVKLHPNNVKRVIRALEVFHVTGKSFSKFALSEEDKYKSKFDYKYFVLAMDREILYQRINMRVDLMVENGLIEEVRKLKALGCTTDMQSMKGIGYKELLYYLNGDLSLGEAVEMIKKGSRNYAKRQLTWFRHNPNTIWIDRAEQSDKEVLDFILNKLQ
ncbi:tRNA (adenosine(37)-N6)-dimethylallyltransferase MiaA [Clostridium oryzae]|uniref:tRNA dimethylallyltransferase n=1 Tax=Clostridium oryzae TaxID=1450648 RepID=A0A1V4IAP2_9CLOT|nr:tRNA (adenosine(37)-N6)-dimethylallyltransferase MiaA [Clostridium oryzae]OPJ56587.1 tRNA dimethylallyltransferase [Clostridium oryzae]